VEPELAVVYSPREWANRLVRHVTDHGGGRVRLRVVDRRVALEEDFEVLIAEDVTSFLDARFVLELRNRGRRILGVYDPEEPTGKERLIELGVDDVIESTAPAEDFVRRIGRILPDRPEILEPDLAGLVAGLEEGVEGPSVHRPGQRLRGSLTAVGGPPGGTGVTEVAVELARAYRRRGETTLLVDVDEVAPSAAQRLGLPPIPNIRTAIDALFHGTGKLHEALMPVVGGGFELLAGMANPGDWPQVRSEEVAEVAAELLTFRDHVIVNVGPLTEDLARLGGADRYGCTRQLIASADMVVGIGVATPVGVARLVAWIAEVTALAPHAPLHLAVNKTPPNRFVRAEVEAEICRTYVPASLHFLPHDPAVEAAAWRGELVAAGPFTRSVATLAAAVLGPGRTGAGTDASTSGRRRRSGR
jgi:MinD-like ATPase involved in chromosome partitioning or flagellar assembly